MRKLLILLFFVCSISISALAQVETPTNEEEVNAKIDSALNKASQDSILKAEQKAKIKKLQKSNTSQDEEATTEEDTTKVSVKNNTKKQDQAKEGEDSLEIYRKAYIDAQTPKYPPAVIYGQEFFRNGDFKFYQKADDAHVPENYTIGPGDELGIQVYGFSDFKGTYKVGTDGAIYAKELGKIFLKGLTFEEAKRVIRQRLG